MAAQNDAGEVGWRVFVGGGLGRTPMVGKEISGFVAHEYLLPYLEAILRVYNMYGRRDNKYKARIKILVHETGIETIREQVEAEFAEIKDGVLKLPQGELTRITEYFAAPQFEPQSQTKIDIAQFQVTDSAYARFLKNNLHPHQEEGYVSLTISLKPIGGVPGDATDVQMEAIADLAEQYSFDELRVSHEQNLVLPHVAMKDVRAIYDVLVAQGLQEGNAGLISDIIACPGLDYCALANARSIPVAQAISTKFADREEEFGQLKLKISGCINACGHHHVGHIGILGVEKKGTELYQITLGGDATENASVGTILGRGVTPEEVPNALEKLLDRYIAERTGPEETFLDAYRRLGDAPFKEALYG
jgi:sulfite reductase (NADPH) hemoprotein beta-component